MITGIVQKNTSITCINKIGVEKMNKSTWGRRTIIISNGEKQYWSIELWCAEHSVVFCNCSINALITKTNTKFRMNFCFLFDKYKIQKEFLLFFGVWVKRKRQTCVSNLCVTVEISIRVGCMRSDDYLDQDQRIIELVTEKHSYRVAKTHRIPYLYRSFSAKVTYI